MKSSREQFEEWASSQGMNIKKFKHNGFIIPYTRTKTRIACKAWQASRQALSNEEVTTAPFLKVD